ncbi:hypothetical protein OBV_10860 [Oscillibacter valericigenes Sjm18-20]|nr:hypothetical protein OBV_10860 [Oscillibacter valericigenes Sjm18-20]
MFATDGLLSALSTRSEAIFGKRGARAALNPTPGRLLKQISAGGRIFPDGKPFYFSGNLTNCQIFNFQLSEIVRAEETKSKIC